MNNFKPISIEDKAIIESYLKECGTENCSFSFANMFCWQQLYKSEWKIIDNFLVMRMRINGGNDVGYSFPMGSGERRGVIEKLIEYEQLKGERLVLAGMCQKKRDKLLEYFPNRFLTNSSLAYEEYLYEAEKLRTLSGKHLQQKRNHVNKFKSLYPNYEFNKLTEKYFDDCIKLADQWREGHDDQSTIKHEKIAMEYAFANFEALALQGGVLIVDGRVIAFTYGSGMSEKMFITHMEKADSSYQGVFAMINQLFANTLDPKYVIINREEDLGIAGLRQAKRSYNPVAKIKNYMAIEPTQTQLQVKRLWFEAFGGENSREETDVVDSFLMNYFDPERMLSVELDGRIVSMLHIIPFDSTIGRIGYVYAVSTAVDHRGKGFVKEMLKQAREYCHNENFDAMALIPDSEGIDKFYEQFGYKGATPVRFYSADGHNFGTGELERDLAMILPLKEEAQEKLGEINFKSESLMLYI